MDISLPKTDPKCTSTQTESKGNSKQLPQPENSKKRDSFKSFPLLSTSSSLLSTPSPLLSAPSPLLSAPSPLFSTPPLLQIAARTGTQKIPSLADLKFTPNKGNWQGNANMGNQQINPFLTDQLGNMYSGSPNVQGQAFNQGSPNVQGQAFNKGSPTVQGQAFNQNQQTNQFPDNQRDRHHPNYPRQSGSRFPKNRPSHSRFSKDPKSPAQGEKLYTKKNEEQNKKTDEEKPKEALGANKMEILSKLGGFLNFTGHSKGSADEESNEEPKRKKNVELKTKNLKIKKQDENVEKKEDKNDIKKECQEEKEMKEERSERSEEEHKTKEIKEVKEKVNEEDKCREGKEKKEECREKIDEENINKEFEEIGRKEEKEEKIHGDCKNREEKQRKDGGREKIDDEYKSREFEKGRGREESKEKVCDDYKKKSTKDYETEKDERNRSSDKSRNLSPPFKELEIYERNRSSDKSRNHIPTFKDIGKSERNKSRNLSPPFKEIEKNQIKSSDKSLNLSPPFKSWDQEERLPQKQNNSNSFLPPPPLPPNYQPPGNQAKFSQSSMGYNFDSYNQPYYGQDFQNIPTPPQPYSNPPVFTPPPNSYMPPMNSPFSYPPPVNPSMMVPPVPPPPMGMPPNPPHMIGMPPGPPPLMGIPPMMPPLPSLSVNQLSAMHSSINSGTSITPTPEVSITSPVSAPTTSTPKINKVGLTKITPSSPSSLPTPAPISTLPSQQKNSEGFECYKLSDVNLPPLPPTSPPPPPPGSDAPIIDEEKNISEQETLLPTEKENDKTRKQDEPPSEIAELEVKPSAEEGKETCMDTSASVGENAKPVKDLLSLAIEKQQSEILAIEKPQIEILPPEETNKTPQKEKEMEKEKEAEKPKEKEPIPKEKIKTPSKKLNLPLLGKEAAKKLLKSFSQNKAYIKEKSKAEEGEEKPKLTIAESFEDEKKETFIKKKKKSDKVSVIEQIKEEETRIREVLSNTSSMFSSYGIGLGLPEIENFLDNPEALKKFEMRGKDVVEKIEKGQLNSIQAQQQQMTFATPLKESEKEPKSSSKETCNDDSQSTKESKKKESSQSSKESKRKDSKSEGEGFKFAGKEIPSCWRDMKECGMLMSDLRKLIDKNSRRSSSHSRYSSPTRESKRKDSKRMSHFPEFPKSFHEFRAKGAFNQSYYKYYPGSVVQYTETRPSISYSVDCRKYKKHYWTLRELKIRNQSKPEIMEILEDFWNLQPIPETDQPSERFWFSDNYLSELHSDEMEENVSDLENHNAQYKSQRDTEDEDEEEEGKEPRNKKRRIDKEKEKIHSGDEDEEKICSGDEDNKVCSADEEEKECLTDVDDKIHSEEEDEEGKVRSPEEKEKLDSDNEEEKMDSADEEEKMDSADEEEKLRSIENKNLVEENVEDLPTLDGDEEFLDISNPEISDSLLKSASGTKLTVEELNEEYEAFINTLEYKPEESSSTAGLSEDTLDFNSSLLSFDDFPDVEKPVPLQKRNPKKQKPSSLPSQPKTVKAAKQMLLNPNISKRQRKELKKLKKRLKREKNERKRLKKEAKKKKKVEKKLMKKKGKKDIPKNMDITLPKDVTKIKQERNLTPEVKEIKSLVMKVPSPQIPHEKFSSKYKIPIEEDPKQLESKDYEKTSLHKQQSYSYSPVGESHAYSESLGFIEDSHSSQSPIVSRSASLYSEKTFDEDSSNAAQMYEGSRDRYSPSNMSVCSPESPTETSDLYLMHENATDPKHVLDSAASPYSPSSPQTSTSESGAPIPTLITSLETIPLPSVISRPVGKELLSSESLQSVSLSTKVINDSPKEFTKALTIEKDQSESTALDEIAFKKTSTPVIFKLGSKKQTSGLKVLPRTQLPGFAENDEEEERRSPLLEVSVHKMEKPRSHLADVSFPSKVFEGVEKISSLSVGKLETEPKIEGEMNIAENRTDMEDTREEEIEANRSLSQSYFYSKQDKENDDKGECLKSELRSEDLGKSVKKSKESENKKEREKKGEKHRERSPSPKRRDRRRESSPESKRRKRSKSPEENKHSGYQRPLSPRRSKSPRRSRSPRWSRSPRRSRSPRQSRSPRRSRSPRPSRSPKLSRSPRSPSHSDRYYSPDRSRRDSRSQSPSSKWRRIRSPPPKRYKESEEWREGDRRRSRLGREDDRRSSRSSYSPSRSRTRSPEYSHYSQRHANSIDDHYLHRKEEHAENWSWSASADDSKDYFSSDERRAGQREGPRSSPSRSPKRLSLDERLRQEHGVEVENESLVPQEETYPTAIPPPSQPPQRYYWEVNPPPPLPVSACKPQIIRVGNVLRVLTGDSSPEKGTSTPMPPVPTAEEHAYDVGLTSPTPTPTPVTGQKEDFIQTENFINVVPTESFSPAKDEGTLSSPGFLSTPPPPIKPVPPPASTTPVSNPLAFISSLLASSMSSTPTSISSQPPIPPPSEIPIHQPPPPLPETSSQTPSDSTVKTGESAVTSASSLDTQQQQQAIISAAVAAAAASGVTPSNLPIAHLITVLQQQSLLTQPSAPADTTTTTITSAATTTTTEEEVTGSSQPQIPVHPQFDLETFKQQRRERKERKRQEREEKRKARKEKALLKKAQAQQEKLDQLAKEAKNNEDLDEDDIVIKQAMTEVPELGSPVPDYEIYNDDDIDEEEEKKVPFTPLPLPPEKGILIVPTFRIIRSKERKSVSFADGVMPGYGTSPSGGEEIHSPPPQLYQDKEKKKKLRKKKKVRVKVIKQYVVGDTRMDSPPPPPEVAPPSTGVLKLYPGCTHYTCTAPGTFVIYTQQPVKVNGSSNRPGLGNASNVTIPPGMLIHSSALSRLYTDSGPIYNGGVNPIPSSMPHSFPDVTTDTLQTQYYLGDAADIGAPPEITSP